MELFVELLPDFEIEVWLEKELEKKPRAFSPESSTVVHLELSEEEKQAIEKVPASLLKPLLVEMVKNSDAISTWLAALVGPGGL